MIHDRLRYLELLGRALDDALACGVELAALVALGALLGNRHTLDALLVLALGMAGYKGTSQGSSNHHVCYISYADRTPA
jgi:hypothetical protein